ncbi:B3/4 domain-containing protein [Maribellus sediminis]|uniref:B3/B4 domain-containing protein n=1 Tax=Maribellus sediminis TaxID=2696285 RepID=UPI0014304B85|nr:phenylalanine--tRNA ligase beta subunit-related protein [Maribellus sediminis]
MQKIEISEILKQKVPELKLSCIACTVEVEANNAELWQQIEKKIGELHQSLKIEEISQLPAIAASRKAYKTCGKDPARYRLSAEALLRRAVNRNEIYQVNNVVDALNLVSVTSGFSIGGYDADKIQGQVKFGIGEKDEPYTGIGRGELNIEYMPVFRDDQGAFGTPTSDSVRTSVSEETRRFLMIIIDYGAQELLEGATQMAVDLLTRFAGATDFELKTISAN